MFDYFRKAKLFVNRSPLRQRALVLFGMIVIILFVWSYGVDTLIQSKAQQAKKTQAQLKKKITHTVGEIDVAITKGGSLEKLKKEEKDSRAQLSGLTTHLKALHAHIVSTEKDENVVMHRLLNPGDGLQFVSLKKQGDRAIGEPHMKIDSAGILMNFTGNYFSLMDYLEQAEDLHWEIFWDKLTYKVTNYPQADISIEVRIPKVDYNEKA